MGNLVKLHRIGRDNSTMKIPMTSWKGFFSKVEIQDTVSVSYVNIQNYTELWYNYYMHIYVFVWVEFEVDAS